LIHQGFLRAVNGRGTKFATNVLYQWRKTAMEIQNEPTHKKAQKDADRSDMEYKRAVRTCEQTRLLFEAATVDYAHSLQTVMQSRIRLMKESIMACLKAETLSVPGLNHIQDKALLFLESLDAERELQTMADRDRTGCRPIPPIIYRKYGSGTSEGVCPLSCMDDSFLIMVVDVWNWA
jgi:hypothetical protein